MNRYRFPGLRSFEESDAAIFNGRTKEKQCLFDLIMVERVVVMFARSGAGKTSLLRAGIVPMLTDLPYQPVFIRLNHREQPLLEQAVGPIAQVFGVSIQPGQSLWEYLQTINACSGNITPILFFDQFEELFTLYDTTAARAELIAQLADVINETLPESVRKRLKDQADTGGNQQPALEKSPKVKVVFSIRSDQLNYLHNLSERIPGILRNRFELKGLRPDQAREAILKPAQQHGSQFACAPFEITPEALNDIVTNLAATTNASDPAAEIESFQLQLVCSHLEAQMLEQQEKGITPLKVLVSTYGGKTGLVRLLAGFYQDTIQRIDDQRQQYHARRLIENELVKNERRISVAEAAITGGEFPVSLETLRLLVNKRLLRREERPGLGNYFELAHDTLLSPVVQFKRERELQEAAEKARQERDAEARKRRRAVVYTGIVGLLALIAFVAFIRAWRQEQKTRFSFLYTAAQLQAEKNPTLAFRLGEQAWKLEPQNLQAQGMLLHTFYGTLYAVDDTFFATPHYREIQAKWAKPVGKKWVLTLDPDLRRLHILNPDSLQEQILAIREGNPVADAALSPDGKWMVSVHQHDSIARLWQVADGKLLQTMVHQGPVGSVAWSPDGHFFTTNASDNSQRVWDPRGKLVASYENKATADLVPNTAFSPDAKQLVVLSNDSTLCLFEPPSKLPAMRYIQSQGNIVQVDFSLNSQYLSVLAFDPLQGILTLSVLDRQGNQLFSQSIDRPSKAISSAVPGNDGQRVLIGTKDSLVGWLYLPQDSFQMLGRPFDQHQGALLGAIISSNAAYIASAGIDKVVKVWDSQNQLLLSLPQEEKMEQLFFTGDNRYLIARTANGTTRLWGLKKNPIAQLPALNVSQAFFDPSSGNIATLDRNRQWGFWDPLGDTATQPAWMTDALAYAQSWGDKNSLLIRTKSNAYLQWDTRSGKSQALPMEYGKVAATASHSPIFAIASGDTAVEVKALSGKRLGLLQQNGKKIEQLTLSPDGKYAGILYRYRPNKAETYSVYEVWVEEILTQQSNLVLSGEKPLAIDFPPDGRRFIVSKEDALLEWDLKKQTLRQLPGRRPDGVSAIAQLNCSPDGRWMATVAEDRTISIWSGDGHWLHTFSCGRSRPNFVRFSQDGGYLLFEYHWPNRNKQALIIPLDPEWLRSTFDKNLFFELPAMALTNKTSFINQ